MNYKIYAFLFLIVSTTLINCQGLNFEECRSNRDCKSKSCRKGRCAQLTCRNDKACLKAGLFDQYCRRRGPKIFRSECVAKRGRPKILNVK